MLRNLEQRRMRLATAMQARVAKAPAASAEDGLEIAGVRAWQVREPQSGRRYAVLKVTSRSGAAGYGECAELTDADVALARGALENASATAYEQIAPRLASRPAVRAGVNVALLDLAARSAKVPLYQFLGGPTRFKVRAMAPLEGDSNAALLESLDLSLKAGHRAFLVPAPRSAARNQGQAFVAAARKRLESLRTAAGDGADFVLDGGGALSPGDAANLCQELENFHLYWFDEPCPAANLGAASRLAAGNVTPLGFGRAVHQPARIQELLREDAVDVIRPAIGWNGITQIRRMAALAEAYYVAVAPWHDGGPLATAAALHLAACLPNFFIQQIPMPRSQADRDLRAAIAGADLEKVSGGFTALPSGSGLGITINETRLEERK